ncbi:F-box incomplete domain containing protein [Pandoravirus dulcis]|uniref:F-box incomplete domain containing protein n=1 Tax=Pandoravirus dulcis TaxID=1349409 RepID=S4VYJ8_9VIRU|nr:F-box incomplete domain containing protein [Pandoravirus dulcis]AGO82944.1 F-box incomplete domain containing protein [Pandoravirus dulcis]
MDSTRDLPAEILAAILSPCHLRPSAIARARLVCRRWGGIGGDALARERSHMATEACAPGGACAHQWVATAALVEALVDDSVPALLRVLDTDMIGPDDRVDCRGWTRLTADTATVTMTELAVVSTQGDVAVFNSFAFSDEDGAEVGLVALVVTPLVMAFAHGALQCARVLIDRGARPMPHVDALISFLVDRFACRDARAVQFPPTVRREPHDVHVIPPRPDQPTIADVLRVVLETFPRGKRAPLGVVPPLKALVMAVARDAEWLVHGHGAGEHAADQSDLTRKAARAAGVLLDAGYDPRAPWRCRGPYNVSRLCVVCPTGLSRDPPQGATRIEAFEMLSAETPCDNASFVADWFRQHYGTAPGALDALAKAYADRADALGRA